METLKNNTVQLGQLLVQRYPTLPTKHETGSDNSPKEIEALRIQHSYFKLLLDLGYTPPYTTPSKHPCRLATCGKAFPRLDHLSRHIRKARDPAHKILADIINQKYCTDCSKTLQRSTDLVKHDKAIHGAEYISILDKFWCSPRPRSYRCGISDCGRAFPRSSLLAKHIHRSCDSEHKKLSATIDRKSGAKRPKIHATAGAPLSPPSSISVVLDDAPSW